SSRPLPSREAPGVGKSADAARTSACATSRWALGFLLLLAPSSSLVPAADLMFEHRIYFPLMCLVIAAGLLLETWPRRAGPVALMALAALLAVTMARNPVWHDDRSLWSDVIEKSPGKARGYFQLGQTYTSDDPATARQWYERGLQLDPRSPI